MYTYYSTFISGAKEIVKSFLPQNIKDLKIIKLMEGGILYKSSKDPEEIDEIRFFGNTFLVLKIFENIKSENAVESMIREGLTENEINKNKGLIGYLKERRTKTFRMYPLLENKLVPISKKVSMHFENFIENTIKSKVEIDTRAPDLEFSFLYKTENIGFFMLKTTKNKKKLERGELKQELANILCLLSDVKNDDIILDPFCSLGSIPLERSRVGDFKGIFASDDNEDGVKFLKEKIKKIDNKKLNKSFFIKNMNFFENKYDENYFSTIISSPTFKCSEKSEMENFYQKVLLEMYRITKAYGNIIILTAKRDDLSEILGNMRDKFKLVSKYDISEMGKNFCIFKINPIK